MEVAGAAYIHILYGMRWRHKLIHENSFHTPFMSKASHEVLSADIVVALNMSAYHNYVHMHI